MRICGTHLGGRERTPAKEGNVIGEAECDYAVNHRRHRQESDVPILHGFGSLGERAWVVVARCGLVGFGELLSERGVSCLDKINGLGGEGPGGGIIAVQSRLWNSPIAPPRCYLVHLPWLTLATRATRALGNVHPATGTVKGPRESGQGGVFAPFCGAYSD